MASDLSFSDKQVLSSATNSVKLEEKSVKEFITNFADKGYFGLWQDAKGFFNVSDQETVLKAMEGYKQVHQGILKCIQSATENGENSYKEIEELYQKLEEMEREADVHCSGKSKALCNLAKTFLDNHWKLDHNLKRVECIVLQQDIKKTKETVEKLSKKLDRAIENFQKLQEDNQKLQNSVDHLQKENREFKDSVENLIREMMGNMAIMMAEMRNNNNNNPGPK